MSDSELMQMLNTSMRYNTQRQKVLAENISNIDTPGYQARDLKKLDFNQMATSEHQLAMATTSPKHINSLGGNQTFGSEADHKNFEVRPTGNSVVLDEQMGKISDTGASYQVANSVYRKYTQLLRAALGNH